VFGDLFGPATFNDAMGKTKDDLDFIITQLIELYEDCQVLTLIHTYFSDINHCFFKTKLKFIFQLKNDFNRMMASPLQVKLVMKINVDKTFEPF